MNMKLKKEKIQNLHVILTFRSTDIQIGCFQRTFRMAFSLGRTQKENIKNIMQRLNAVMRFQKLPKEALWKVSIVPTEPEALTKQSKERSILRPCFQTLFFWPQEAGFELCPLEESLLKQLNWGKAVHAMSISDFERLKGMKSSALQKTAI